MVSEIKAILRTIVYSDIFDYPLTRREIWKFLIVDKKITRAAFEKALLVLPATIVYRDGFYCLKGRESIVAKRKRREKESVKKILLAKKVAKRLSLMPTVLFVGISGSLAMRNADSHDDIDFFIITKKNTLWTTRFLLLLLLEFLGLRRGRRSKKVANKICVNMLIDESSLLFSKEKQNLYIAHEVVQLLPLFERENMHDKFLGANAWIKKILPHSLPSHLTSGNSVRKGGMLRFSAFEQLARFLQLRSINKHKTTETISDTLLAFHPDDYTDKILNVYQKRIKTMDAI